MARADVTVLGAGVWGLSIAWECARRGARVCVIDPAGIGAGASGGLVGALSPYAPEGWNPIKAFQLASLISAPAFWTAIEEASDLPTGYGRTGRLMPLGNAENEGLARANARQAGAAQYWGTAGAWTVMPSPLPSLGSHVVCDTLAARLNPRATLVALAGAAGRAGVAIAAEGPEDGTVIHATGAPGLVATGLGRGIKGQALLLAHTAPDHPQVYADGLYIVPHADGTTAIGSTSELTWDDPASTDAQLDALHARAIALMPDLAGAPVLARWAALRPRAHTRQPVLGFWPDRPGHILANGAFKIGFGLAPSVASVIADLALNGAADIPQAFHPPA